MIPQQKVLLRREKQLNENYHVFSENNKAWFVGIICKTPTYSYTRNKTDYYSSKLKVPRLSNNQEDIIPIMISSYLLDKLNLSPSQLNGQLVEVGGKFYSRSISGCLNLFLSVKLIHTGKDIIEKYGTNCVYLDGYICQKPSFCISPTGYEYTYSMLAVDKHYKVCNYIPFISWNKSALELSLLPVKKRIRICGRFQSRTYKKDTVIKIAYELSAFTLNADKF